MKPVPPASSPSDRVARYFSEQGLVPELQAKLKAREKKRRRLTAAAAVAVCLAAVGAWHLGRQTGATAKPATAIVSAPESRTLEDRSRVQLRDGAKIEVRFSSGRREVALLAGEAFFEVEKDAVRPFVVTAAGVETKAVGTAFFVSLTGRSVDVLVKEGAVAVSTQTSAGPALVAAGNAVSVDLAAPNAPAPAPAPVPPDEIVRRDTWRYSRLTFAKAPLSEVIPLFNAHSGSRIVLGDPSLGALELSGTLRADKTETLLRFLELEYGLGSEERGGEIVLKRM